MVEGGFTSAEALRLATVNPAKFLNRSNIGQVAPGMQADLVILNADPLENISNTSLIEGVMLKGIYLDRAKLDELLNQAKEIINE